MNEERLNAILRELDPAEAAEIREFAQREPWEQNIYMFRELKALKQSKPLTARLVELGYVGAFIAYILFDRGALNGVPPFGGSGK